MTDKSRIVLTGFMGVGKTTVAKCLSYILDEGRVDLDDFIERTEKRTVAEIIASNDISYFRQLETKYLSQILNESTLRIISLGGGAWTIDTNRQMISSHGCISIWLEATFEHCWRNISVSRNERPLAKDKQRAQELYAERRNIYCLADWHLVVKPELTSFDLARFISDEIL